MYCISVLINLAGAFSCLLFSVLVKAARDTPVHATKDRNKRLLREMAAFQREPHPAFSIYPAENQ